MSKAGRFIRENRIYVCPECPHFAASPEGLGEHIERHRPADAPVISKRGKKVSHQCPRGCGREFSEKVSRREHAKACDGAPPISSLPRTYPAGIISLGA